MFLVSSLYLILLLLMKLKLNEALMEEEFFEETSLIGIASALPAYRLCWVLNDLFDIDFVCETDMTISISAKKGEPVHYLPVYQYLFPNGVNRYLLYKLKADNNLSLLPEAGRIDYVWLVQTGRHKEDAADIIAGLKRSPDIVLSQSLDLSQLKNLKNLLI